MVVVEADSKYIKVQGNKVNNLLEALNSIADCETVHLMVDRHMEHSKIADIMQIIKQSNCDKISIQSV